MCISQGGTGVLIAYGALMEYLLGYRDFIEHRDPG